MIMPINSQTSIIMWDSEIKSMLNILIIPKIHHDTQSAWNVSNTLKLDTTGIPTSEYQYANKAHCLATVSPCTNQTDIWDTWIFHPICKLWDGQYRVKFSIIWVFPDIHCMNPRLQVAIHCKKTFSTVIQIKASREFSRTNLFVFWQVEREGDVGQGCQ